MHNINNEGTYTDSIFEEVHNKHTVPKINTPEKEVEIMTEFKKPMYIPTQEQSGLITECLQKDTALICIVKIKYIGRIRLDPPLVCLLGTGSTDTMIQNRCLQPGSRPMLPK